MVVSNPTKKYIYFNKNTLQTYESIYHLINAKNIKNLNLSAHEKNISSYYLRPDNYNEILEGVVPIPPRSRWSFIGNVFKCINNNNSYANYKPKISDIISISQRLCSIIFKKNIAIELSGGLDTSIIIGIIKSLGYNPLLIGITSPNYEFRTESHIQNLYKKNNSRSILIDGFKSLPFSNLKSTPLHQLPSSSSIYYMHAFEVLQQCKNHNIDMVLSGNGLDALLCENPLTLFEKKVHSTWYTWMLDDNWLNENVYNINSKYYFSGAASTIIIKSLWSLRNIQGQKDDPKKLWARKFFTKFIPIELSKYTYKADFSGSFLEGLLSSIKDIEEIFKVTYDVTGIKAFTNDSLKQLIINAHVPNEINDKIILARVSYANWIYGLVRDKII